MSVRKSKTKASKSRPTNENVKAEMGWDTYMTFHCEQCNLLLGDSSEFFGDLQCMGYVMCHRVTNNVVVSNKMEMAAKGKMATCIYQQLKCSGCQADLGLLISATPKHLDELRSFFLLDKEHISCYVLNSCSVVKATEITFRPFNSLLEQIKKISQEIEVYTKRLSRIEQALRNNSSETD